MLWFTLTKFVGVCRSGNISEAEPVFGEMKMAGNSPKVYTVIDD